MAEKARIDERMTVEAFLDWDDGTDLRHELVDGRVVAMNPPAAAHAIIVARLCAALLTRLPKGCQAYAGGGARNADDDWNYRIPDVSVSCGRSTGQWVEEPRLVCEILSPATAKFDVTGKLDFYRSIPSIAEILVLRANERHAVLWRRAGDHWTVHDFIGAASLDLAVTTAPVPLDELYEHLEEDEPG